MLRRWRQYVPNGTAHGGFSPHMHWQLSNWMTAQLAAPPKMSLSLDELTLGRVLGKGVSGRVLLATHTVTKAAYALKTIEKARIKGQAQLTQLYREKEFLGALQHAAIVRFHTTFKDEEHLYFLLDKLDGAVIARLVGANRVIETCTLSAGCALPVRAR